MNSKLKKSRKTNKKLFLMAFLYLLLIFLLLVHNLWYWALILSTPIIYFMLFCFIKHKHTFIRSFTENFKHCFQSLSPSPNETWFKQILIVWISVWTSVYMSLHLHEIKIQGLRGLFNFKLLNLFGMYTLYGTMFVLIIAIIVFIFVFGLLSLAITLSMFLSKNRRDNYERSIDQPNL